jgi:hypothetical protein
VENGIQQVPLPSFFKIHEITTTFRVCQSAIPKSPIRNSSGILGTGSAEEEDGKHANKRAPAAITSLSAASRCASHPPSDPSV